MNQRDEQLEGDDLVIAAAGLQSSALQKLLGEQYSRVCRIAHALARRPAIARKIVLRVVHASAQFLPRWKSGQEADNWFLHHTILMVREISGPTSPSSDQDYLIQHANDPGPAYLAFVRALRLLPSQQREAFLLTHGERLDPRQLAIAMDCSTSAAANHLMAASETLKSISLAGTFEAQTTALVGVYASLTPPENIVLADVSAAAGRIHRGRWRRIIIRLLELLVLGLLAWTIWRLSRMIVI